MTRQPEHERVNGVLTRRRLLIGAAGVAAGGAAVGIGLGQTHGASPPVAYVRSVAEGSQPQDCPRASTPGRRH